MGIIEPADKTIQQFKGLHLYHAGKSNCAGRVRILIEEKRLAWTSHFVDIATKENISAEYFAINPKGVVPTLVLDGEVVVESNDILVYLESRFPEPSFLPKTERNKENMRTWLKRSGDIHIPGIKTYNYNRTLAKTMERTEEDAKLYRSLQKDPELLSFHAKHDPGEAFPQEDIDNAVSLLMTAIIDMDAAIAREGWLAGDQYSLADISWAPSVAAFSMFGLPLHELKHLTDWFERVKSRPAWERGWSRWADGPKPKEKVLEIAP